MTKAKYFNKTYTHIHIPLYIYFLIAISINGFLALYLIVLDSR